MASADIPAIGAHCSLERCNVNDFLPIKCRCDRLFCKDHISPESHSCPVLSNASTLEPQQFSQKLQRCAAQGCAKPSLEAFVAQSSDKEGRTPALCPRCTQAFCARYAPPLYGRCTVHSIAPIAVIVNQRHTHVLRRRRRNPLRMKLLVHCLQKRFLPSLRRLKLPPRRLPSPQNARLHQRTRRRLPSCARSS